MVYENDIEIIVAITEFSDIKNVELKYFVRNIRSKVSFYWRENESESKDYKVPFYDEKSFD